MKQDKEVYIAHISRAYKDFPAKADVSSLFFKEVIKTFNALLIHSIITTGISYKLPFGLGVLGATKKKINKHRMLNWKETKKTGERTHFSETYNSGFFPSLFWNKTRPYGARFTFNDIWRLRWTKSTRRLLYEEAIINNKITKYY